jgi:hypothetical protein
MATAPKQKLEEVRPIVSAVFLGGRTLSIVNLRENAADAPKGMHISITDQEGKRIPLVFIAPVESPLIREGANVLNLPPLVSIKAYSSRLEVREVAEGDDANLAPGTYYRWVRPYGSVVIPVVVDLDGSVNILLQQVYRHQIGKFFWELPMGGVEEGETPLAAAGREFREETGLSAKQTKEAISGHTD